MPDHWQISGVCLFLVAIIWVVFGQTLRHEFVNYDDDIYVYENPEVANGLTLQGIIRAFTHITFANWHPLTSLSHMLDCQFYGLNPGGHHLTNVLLHAATAILLFLMLRNMTGFPWRSAFVAAVFAVHPLRVESVAWVAERKDVLSGLFFILTIGAYVRYVRRPWSAARYGLVVLLFTMGLMCKPMLVTLPLVLLLLDYWPLNRWRTDNNAQPDSRLARRLLFEKLPLLGLSVASCVITIFAQKTAFVSFEQVHLPLRMGNALIASVIYLGQMFWPSALAVLYPFDARNVGISKVILSLVVLAGISVIVFVLRRRAYLLTGWLWYLVMLVPVIGIVQVGNQAHADRYTYLPQIGLYVMLTWAAADLFAGWRHQRSILAGGCAGIPIALILCAHAQAAYWRDSKSLWTHTLACTSDNFLGQNNLASALLKHGSVDEAIFHFQKALQLKPDSAQVRYNLGSALLKKGNVDEAIHYFQGALQIQPDYADAQNNLGNALHQKGDVYGAIYHYQRALQIRPDYAEAENNLGSTLLEMGRANAAIYHFQKALHFRPDYAEAHYNLGNALLKDGSRDEAISHYQKALATAPNFAEAQNNLAWVLATCPQASLRDGKRAVELAQSANALDGYGNPTFLGTLAAAYAEAGRFAEAVETAQRASQLAEQQSNPALANTLRSQMKVYQGGVPFHSH